MPNFAHLNIAKRPEEFVSSQITQSGGQSRKLADESSDALLVQAKARNQPVPALSRPALKPKPERLKVEKLKIDRHGLAFGGVVQGSQESGWITLQADASKTGLHTQGRWQADIEIATNLARVLLAQFLAAPIQRTSEVRDARAVGVVLGENIWIDILLHQVESQRPALCALSMLELAAYRSVNGEVKLLKSVKSSPMPMEMISVFTLGYRFKDSKITIDICSDLDRLTTTHIDIGNFGGTLPIIKLRSGRALPNGISRAKYRQIVSWSA